MSDDRDVVTVRILDKDYTISCLPDERDSLVTQSVLAADQGNERMQEMRDGSKVLGTERMAVMAALNVIHEREQLASSQHSAFDSARKAVDMLVNKLDTAIGRRETA